MHFLRSFSGAKCGNDLDGVVSANPPSIDGTTSAAAAKVDSMTLLAGLAFLYSF